PVVGKSQLVLGSNGRVDGHLNQSVFTVPDVIPAAIAEQISVLVVAEYFGLFGHVDVAGNALAARDNDVGPDRSAEITDWNLLPEVLLFPISRLPSHRHGIRQNARAHDVHVSRNISANDLIENVVCVIGYAQARAICVAAGLTLLPVSNPVRDT